MLIRVFFALQFALTPSFFQEALADLQRVPPASNRVVSLAPSLTEIVYALGAGESLVGVTEYCDYPSAAKKLPKVGALTDFSAEAVVALRPSLVLGLVEHQKARRALTPLGIEVVLSSQNSLGEIYQTIELVGEKLDKESEAQALVLAMKNEISQVREKLRAETRPRVLIVVGGASQRSSVESIYAAGQKTLYSELIELAYAENALQSNIAYSKLSAEGLLSVNPEVVIDLIPSIGEGYSKATKKNILKSWSTLPFLDAVKNNRVHVLTEEFLVNPGPRSVETFKLLCRVIHGDYSSHVEN